jgi:3-dehydroquinate dehydratase-2
MNAPDKILVLHGPNLNLLGLREPQHYGCTTLETINADLQKQTTPHQVSCVCFQSNSESELINRVHEAAQDNTRFILLNPAAFTHTSVALRDALSAVKIPFIEIHLSNVYAREPFRHHSYFSDLALGVITGLGAQGYSLALSYALTYLSQTSSAT